MKKIYVLALIIIGFFFYANVLLAEQDDLLKNYETEKGFLNAVEIGEADAESFVAVLRDNRTILNKISPSAIANYMEAIANEGMLENIPNIYFNDEEVKTALDVVLQDLSNIANNWDVYKDYCSC